MALYVGSTRYKPMVNGSKASFVWGTDAPQTQVNLWNMSSSNLVVATAGYTANSKSIDSDGSISWLRSSTSTSARIQIALSASELGLVNGKEYTVKVWVADSKLTANRDSQMWVNGAYQQVYGPNPISITWTQANDKEVKVGNLYPSDFPVGEPFSFKVMVAEGDHIDDYVPYSS